MNRKDNAKSARVTDALLNYETVKYFSNEKLEVANLGTAIGEYQEIEFKLLASLAALNVLQSSILFTGLVCGLLVCVKANTPQNPQPMKTWQGPGCEFGTLGARDMHCSTGQQHSVHLSSQAAVRPCMTSMVI